MEKNQPFKAMKGITKIILIALMAMLVLGMALGTLHLMTVFFEKMVSPDPYYFLINVEDLYTLFSVLLIIAVGYELFKSLLLIFHHDSIPVKSILKIAAIAMANKIITLNIKEASFEHMMGLGVLIVAVGIAFFFYSKEKDSVE
jgi:uncharacterized membrane protein (DUF373 family)